GESTKMLVATATASTMVATAGVGAVSQQALPGDLLYPVKQVTEDVRMGFASGLQETGRLHLMFATERLEELILGLEGYDPDTVIDLLTEMDLETLTGIEELLQVYEQTGNELILVVLERFAEQQRAGLSSIFDQMPPEAAPFVDRSLEILRRIEVTLEAITFGCDSCGAEGAGPSSLFTAPGDGPALGSDSCDCVGFLPGTLARDAAAGLDGTFSSDDAGEGTTGSNDGGSFDGAISTTIPSLPEPLDTATRDLEGTITSITGTENTSTTTVDDTTTTVSDTVDDTVSDTTGTVEDTTGTVEDTTSGTTDTVDDTTTETTETVTETTSETTSDTTGTVDDLLEP
ncbi:MAG: DUF5667 domain-containing protein, partial [Nitriliruptorales bacterium]|nr:DUF5667 domain-containing protein [Nitriliruptorales bacterium]